MTASKTQLRAKTISGFRVSVERQKVWQAELDILKRIDAICRKHQIEYSVSGGTLLGAVRHKGFIPWDDDIDIVMLRTEYDRFLKVAKKEIKEPLFVQNWATEPLYERGHTQIRNSNTTAIIDTDIINGPNYNKGIFVDIFPIDNIPDNPIKRRLFVRRACTKKMLLRGPTDSRIKRGYQTLFGKQKLINKYHKFAQKYNRKRTQMCGAIEFRPFEFKYDRAWFDNYIDLPFEDMKVRAFADYDAMLTRQFGDYMTIPKVKAESVHGNTFFDTENSYKIYNDRIKEICEKL